MPVKGIAHLRRPVVQSCAGMALALAIITPAWGRSRPFQDSLFTLDAGWRGRFAARFKDADGAYLVRVRRAGALRDVATTACDEMNFPPPPPSARNAGRKALQAFAAGERRAAAANARCTPERVQVKVAEVLKGPRRTGWLESQSLIDVVSAAPVEPVPGRAPAKYGDRVHSILSAWCSPLPARRLSVTASYLVFVYNDPAGGVGGPFRIGDAFLAGDATPFLREARKLAVAGRDKSGGSGR